MLNINATEKERELQAAAARREARKDMVRTVVFACIVAALFFAPYYALTGSWKGAIAVPAFLALRVLVSGRARRAVWKSWKNRS